jgi:DNA polymerase III subunit delta
LSSAPSLRPAYLVHGDDHGAVAERKAGLRALAERLPDGAAGVELLDGEDATPAGVAEALRAMTLTLSRRVIIVDGAERWRESDVAEQLAPAMDPMPPATTLAVFAREEARTKAPSALHDAVERAGGQVVPQMTVKPWELPGWAREQGARLGLALDSAASKALVSQVGERQQRLLRELEKLALEEELEVAGPAGAPRDPTGAAGDALRRIGVEEIEARAAQSAERKAFALADALVGGHARPALASYLRLRDQGERPAGLIYVIAQRLRDALALALRMRAGESRADLKRGMRMPSRAAEHLLADISRTDPESLREALALMADMELDSRGGAPIRASRTTLAGMSEDTLAVRTIEAIARQS